MLGDCSWLFGLTSTALIGNLNLSRSGAFTICCHHAKRWLPAATGGKSNHHLSVLNLAGLQDSPGPQNLVEPPHV